MSKRKVRSFRIREDLLSEANTNNMNVTEFIERTLEQYFKNITTCPTCGKKHKPKDKNESR